VVTPTFERAQLWGRDHKERIMKTSRNLKRYVARVCVAGGMGLAAVGLTAGIGHADPSPAPHLPGRPVAEQPSSGPSTHSIANDRRFLQTTLTTLSAGGQINQQAQLQLQMTMDRFSKSTTTESNVMKNQDDALLAMLNNLKG
jgi:hypothetical protein